MTLSSLRQIRVLPADTDPTNQVFLKPLNPSAVNPDRLLIQQSPRP
jgi:hypothetical protein